MESVRKSLRQHVSKREKDLSYRDFAKILAEASTQSTSLKSLTFPAEVTRSRGYILYCNLYQDKKKVPAAHQTQEECFEQAVRRYGLAVPFPLFVGEIAVRNGFGSADNLRKEKSSRDLLSLPRSRGPGSPDRRNPALSRMKDQDKLTKKGPPERVRIREPEEEGDMVSKKLSIYDVDSPAKLRATQQSNFLTIPGQTGGGRPKSPSPSPTRARGTGTRL